MIGKLGAPPAVPTTASSLQDHGSGGLASVDDKLEAIKKARAYAATRAAVGQNLAEFPAPQSTLRTHVNENAEVSKGNWLGGRDSNPDSLVQSQLSYH